MRRSVVVLTLIVLMVTVMLSAGCSKANNAGTSNIKASPKTSSDDEGTNAPESKKPDDVVEIEYMRMDPSWDPLKWGEDPVSKEMTRRTGIRLKCLAPSGEGDQVANVMLMSDDYPELIGGYSQSTFNKYVDAGALYSIDELVEKYNCPHILDGTTVPSASLAVYRSGDGKLYSVPTWYSEDGFGSVGQTIQVRNDIYQELGEPEIKTMDEFYKLLETVRDSHRTYNGINMWPLAVHWQDSGMLGDVANIYGSKIMGYKYYNEDTKKVEFFLRAPELIKAVQFLNKCYNKGIVDPECFTFDGTEMGEAYAQGKYVFTMSWFWNLWTADSLLSGEDPNQYYKAIEVPQGTPDVQQHFGYYHTAGDLCLSVTKNCRHPEAATHFIDFCLSDEGQILDFYGIEGETMEFKDGQPYLKKGIYDHLMADWDGYRAKSGIRLWDQMKSQKWNWERQAESPVRSANRAMAAKYAFDGTYLKPLQVKSTTLEGILFAEIEANIIPQITEIVIDPDASKVVPEMKSLLKSYESKGLSKLEDVWTDQYSQIIANAS